MFEVIPIEVTSLRADTLVVHEAGIDAAGIESKIIAQSIVEMVRRLVAPGSVT
jgi:hypothetical protein